MLAQAQKSKLDWELFIAPLMFSHNTAVHKSTRQTPFYTMFGYDPRVPLWPEYDVLDPKDFRPNPNASGNPGEWILQQKQIQQQARKIAHHNNQHERESQKEQHDADAEDKEIMFHEGDTVWIPAARPVGKN